MQMQACIYETQINLWQHRLRFTRHHHGRHHHHHHPHRHCCRWLPLTTLDNTLGIQVPGLWAWAVGFVGVVGGWVGGCSGEVNG